MVNIQSKEVLARLLATENLTVVHQNVQTASFNVKDRVLTLPLWDEMENYTYDHLVGHEVAHALYTPADEWEKQAKAGGSGFQSFMNVVEDARIEKLVQRRYPGLRKSFIQSYKKLLADGFFGKSADEINNFKLIDRLNILFKCGQTVGVQFSKEEKTWITEIENAETFEQVVDIATRLYGKAKEEFDEEQQAMSQAFAEMQAEYGDEEDEFDAGEYGSDYEDESEFDAEADDGSEEESDAEQGEKTDTEQTSDVDEDSTANGSSEPSESDVEGSEATTVGHEGGEQGPQSITDKSLNENISKEFASDPNKTFYNLKLPTDKPQLALDRVVDYKEILSLFDDNQEVVEAGGEFLKIFQRDNKKTINYLVKEFEMKKKAAEYQRATVSKTGVIDTLKMNNYKFSDDIFKKMTVLPEGKNHGLLMFIDWSGSMVDQLKNTIDQLLNLVMFCKQVNIPFEVYAFSDRYYNVNNRKTFKHRDIFDLYEIGYDDKFHLLQLFTNKMGRSDYQKMLKVMLAIGEYMDNYNARMRYNVPYNLYLGGTPLDDAIVAGITLHKIFKDKNRLDVVNTVFLTDGASAALEFSEEVVDNFSRNKQQYIHENRLSFRQSFKAERTVVYVTDPVTKKRYRWINQDLATPQLLKMFKEHTQSNAIGFHILPYRKPSAIREIPSGDYFEREQLWENLKKDKFCIIPNYGYTQYFGILGGRALATSNGQIQVSEDASKSQIRNAFKKANGNRKGSRVMLSKFIDLVA